MSSENSSGSIAAWAIGIAIIIGVGFLLTRPASDFAEKPAQKPNIETAWVKGDKNAAVIIEEFSDFECPACAAYAPVVSGILDQFGSDVAVAYRHFPLKSIHRHAESAARAAEAAGKQNKFWEMHDKIFENQAVWAAASNPATVFEEYASELALDMDTFKKDRDSAEVQARVDADLAMGNQHGIRSTPSFVVNGVLVKNLRGADTLRSAVQAALDKEMTDK